MNHTSEGDFLLTFADLISGAASANNIVGLPLNAYVTWLILSGARETLASDFFALNLAISEIGFALFCIGFGFFKCFICPQVFMFSNGLLFTARPLFLCCICVEYYAGVVHPVLFLQFKPLRYRVACCCGVWLSALVSCVYSVMTYKNPRYLYGYFVQNFFFFSVIFFCCCSVLRALKRPGPGDKDTEKKTSNTIKRKAFKIILLIVISMSFSFFFYMAAIPLQCCLADTQFHTALAISISLALTTGFIQPLLYLHRAGKLPCFRKL